MSGRSERYLEEMGLGPVWKLRGRRAVRPDAPQAAVPASTVPAAGSASDDKVRLEPSWKARLLREFSQPYMHGLREFLKKEIQARKIIYPRGVEYFAALDHTPFDKVKVVILGQDPYHGVTRRTAFAFRCGRGWRSRPVSRISSSN